MQVFEIVKITIWLSSLVNRLRPSLLRFYYAVLPVTQKTHFQELRSRLRQMPFIYREMGKELLSDYVRTRLRPLRLETLDSLTGAYYLSPASGDEDLRSIDLQNAHDMIGLTRTANNRHIAGSPWNVNPESFSKSAATTLFIALKIVGL
jgi:hypothetical protein